MAEHGRLVAGSSEEAKLGIGGEAGQAVVILILIAVLWLSVVTVIVSACRVAALADESPGSAEDGVAGPGPRHERGVASIMGDGLAQWQTELMSSTIRSDG